MENITENKLNNQNENSANEPILQLREMCRYRMHRVKGGQQCFCRYLSQYHTAIMGPSGCGKSTLLRAINRMRPLSQDRDNR